MPPIILPVGPNVWNMPRAAAPMTRAAMNWTIRPTNDKVNGTADLSAIALCMLLILNIIVCQYNQKVHSVHV